MAQILTTTPSISEMKAATLTLMAAKYSSNPGLTKATDDDVAAKFFMRKSDATALRDCCKKYTFKVSFRAAGENTINRINNGNPCKGHTILDKSIKQRADNTWTYQGDGKVLDSLKGLVGFLGSDGKSLGGVWAWTGKEEKLSLDNVKDQSVCFTGDYDMHDLLKDNKRILAATPDEASAIEAINNAMLNTDSKRKAKIATTFSRNFQSPYALVRHGAQTSFMSFLLSASGVSEISVPATARIPSEDQVMNIDPLIVVFDEKGDAYLLDSIAKIYWYYKINSLLDQIPFYFFFKDLRSTNPTDIASYSTVINTILGKYTSH